MATITLSQVENNRILGMFCVRVLYVEQKPARMIENKDDMLLETPNGLCSDRA